MFVMWKIERIVILFFALMLAINLTIAGNVAASTIYVADDGTGDFTTIQEALNSASPEDEEIVVKSGTYMENVDVNKDDITIRSESGNPFDTIVEADSSSDDVFDVTTDGVKISGFNITGASGTGCAGIYLEGVEYCLIENNTLSNNDRGIFLGLSSSNTLENNTASNNDDGICLEDSWDNTLNNNTVSDNGWGISLEDSWDNTLNNNTASNNGICLDSSSSNTLSNNTVSNSYYSIYLFSSSNDNTFENNTLSNNNDGIHLCYSSSNTLENNTVDSNNDYGILLESSSNDNTLENNTANSNNDYGIFLHSSSSNTLKNNTANSNNNGYGIYLYYSSNNTLENNTANSNNDGGIWLESSSNDNTLENNTANSNNDGGIFLYDSSSNTLENNTASDNSKGIYLSDSSSNTLENNTADSNIDYGIYLLDSSNNSIYNNYFNNNNNAYFEGTNTGNVWNTTKTAGSNIVGGPYLGGNYWAKPDGSGWSQIHDDTDGDGICDVTYDLGGGNIDYLPLLIPSPEETPEPPNDGGDGPVMTCDNLEGDSDETTENIVTTETSQQYVQEGTSVNYEFQNPENCIVDVSFVPEKTVGSVITKVEMLNDFSSKASAPPEGIVYKSMNIQVGNTEFSSSEDNFKNATINFRVEKSWIEENNITNGTITLNRYSEGKWTPLSTSKVSDDADYIHYEAETPGFSCFAVIFERLLNPQGQLDGEDTEAEVPEEICEESKPDGNIGNYQSLVTTYLAAFLLIICLGKFFVSREKDQDEK